MHQVFGRAKLVQKQMYAHHGGKETIKKSYSENNIFLRKTMLSSWPDQSEHMLLLGRGILISGPFFTILSDCMRNKYEKACGFAKQNFSSSEVHIAYYVITHMCGRTYLMEYSILFG